MADAKARRGDVHRIASVLEELIQKLTALSVVTHQVLESVQDNEAGPVAAIISPELLEKMAEQTRLEELYHSAKANQNERGLSSFEIEDENETYERLQKNTRELSRTMRCLPKVVQELRGFQETRPVNSLKFIHALSDMQDVLLKRLSTTVEDDKANSELLQSYLQQERAAVTRRKELERQLAQLRNERMRHSTRSTEAIAKLKFDLNEISNLTENRMWKLGDEYAKKDAENMYAFEAKSAEIDALKQQIQKQRVQRAGADREQNEMRLRSQRIAEKDVEEAIKAQDLDFAEKIKSIEEARRANAKGEAQLLELLTELKSYDEENERVAQHAQIERALRNREEAKNAARAAACCVLQSFWRGIQQREEYLSLKKTAARKGKKGKKK